MHDSKSKPMVSVLMVTYNHEKYIEQAVRSVMMQVTDFDYELIIGEDCSTDSTREIVVQLKEEFPDKIRLLLHKQNIGMIPNMVATYNACTGKYIALCEGDDYWTDPRKLQIQVDYMEAHLECRICFHPTAVVHEFTGPSIARDLNNSIGRYFLKDVLERTLIDTASVLAYRPRNLPYWYNKLEASGDWQLFAWILLDGGSADCITNRNLSVYRKHAGGITYLPTSNAKELRLLKSLRDIKIVKEHILPHHRKHLSTRVYRIHLALARIYSEKRQIKLFNYNIYQYLIYGHRHVIAHIFPFILLVVRCYTPSLYNVLRSSKRILLR